MRTNVMDTDYPEELHALNKYGQLPQYLIVNWTRRYFSGLIAVSRYSGKKLPLPPPNAGVYAFIPALLEEYAVMYQVGQMCLCFAVGAILATGAMGCFAHLWKFWPALGVCLLGIMASTMAISRLTTWNPKYRVLTEWVCDIREISQYFGDTYDGFFGTPSHDVRGRLIPMLEALMEKRKRAEKEQGHDSPPDLADKESWDDKYPLFRRFDVVPEEKVFEDSALHVLSQEQGAGH